MNSFDQALLESDSIRTERPSLQLDRRGFLKVLGGLLICLPPHSALSQESGRGGGGHELPKDLSAWLHIDADGKVKVFTGKVEVGQNIRTSLAQQVAGELRVPFDSITMVMGGTDLVPWDMGTFPLRTRTPHHGAAARHLSRWPPSAGISIFALSVR
jgi:isoquinoline 1-oxidoreductase